MHTGIAPSFCYVIFVLFCILFFFFFNDTATTEIYTLSLHDALPISSSGRRPCPGGGVHAWRLGASAARPSAKQDRKSTRLNSSHANISYAVFCLKKKKKTNSKTNHRNHRESKRTSSTTGGSTTAIRV